MSLAEFAGCAALAFGAPVVMFALTVAAEPVRVIVLAVAAFGWLLSFLLSSLVWFAVVPLRSYLAFGMVFAVMFQVIFTSDSLLLEMFEIVCLLTLKMHLFRLHLDCNLADFPTRSTLC